MEAEIRGWADREPELCTRYLLTRVYSASYVRVVSVQPGRAVVQFGSFFRDMGIDFQLDLEARVRWSKKGATVTVVELDLDGKRVFRKVPDAESLADRVFSVFSIVQKHVVADAMRQLSSSVIGLDIVS